jgi:hypothetical protein
MRLPIAANSAQLGMKIQKLLTVVIEELHIQLY